MSSVVICGSLDWFWNPIAIIKRAIKTIMGAHLSIELVGTL
jgi:hypothetical protein